MPSSAGRRGACRAGIVLLAASVLAPIAGNRPHTDEWAIHVDQQQRQQQQQHSGGGGSQFTVGSANILAESKATRTPGGFPGFQEDALKEHQKRDPKAKDANLWIHESLEKLMFSSDGPRISLLALQEVDMPMYKGLVRFAEGKNGKKKGMIKYWNMYGRVEAPGGTADIPYLVSNEATQQVTCDTQDGKWGGGRAMKCTIAVGGKTLTGLFVHGDSASPPMLPTADFDLIIGDFNIKEEQGVKALLMGSGSGAEPLPDQTTPTLLRSVYKLRKVSQQVENSCNFGALECSKPGKGCTCLNMRKECCSPASEETDPLTGYSGSWCGEDDFKGIKTDPRKKKQCGAALKICTAFKVEGGKVVTASTKVSKEIKDYGLATAETWYTKAQDPLYVWDGNFAKDMGFSLGEPDAKNSCPASVDGGLPETAVDLVGEREDWIAAIPDKFKTLPKVEVWKYKDVMALKTNMAPHKAWPSDHFPIYATLEAK